MDKNMRPIDIVVPLTHKRCGGCHFELPLSQVHEVTTTGYIICEECGKIIYK
jgi:predicted  nucleic acid-binding Zn-ribbon protein